MTVSTPQVPSYREGIIGRIRSGSPTLEAAARHLLAAAGKGYRPLCLKLTGEAFSDDHQANASHEVLSEAIELVHVGSLVHDDILDDAATRRGVTTVHSTWNAKVAVLAGDYLLAQASQRVSSLKDPYLNSRLAEVIGDLCEGELLQEEQTYQLDVSLDAYLDRIAKKTASPFEFACEGGARLSGADEPQSTVARHFGFHLGRLFQLVDDLLDWCAEASVIGKPVGQDLVVGTLTLPVLLALRHAETGDALRAALTPFPDAITPEVRELVTHPAPFAETLAFVAAEGDHALNWLSQYPESPAKTQLQTVLTNLVQRVSSAEARR